MTTRELFEAEFPVPDKVKFDDVEYYGDKPSSVAGHYNTKWIGFQAGAKRKQCVWTYCDDEMAWESECEGMLQIADSPEENEFKYCCFCGGELVEAGYKAGKENTNA